MEYFTFILHILALLALSSILFVPEESAYIPKMIVFLLLFISIIYNRVFICNCIKGWFGGYCKIPSAGSGGKKYLSSNDDFQIRLDALKK